MRERPRDKAKALLSRYASAEVARQFAYDCREQHDSGTMSHTYWSEVLQALPRPSKRSRG